MDISAPARDGSRRASTSAQAQGRRTFRFPIGWKFILLLAAVVVPLVAVSLTASIELSTLKTRLDRVHDDNLASTRAEGRIASGLREAEMLAQRLVTEPDPDVGAQLRGEFRERVAPRVETLLFDLRSLSEDEQDDLVLTRELERTWHSFLAYTSSPEFLEAAGRPPGRTREISENVEQLGNAMKTLSDRISQAEERQAERDKVEARRAYGRTVATFWVMVIVSLVAGVGGALWLIRNVVSRVREYSSFAGTVAEGATNARVRPRGHDELTDLGRALNEMVARDEATRSYEDTQGEFIDALQVTQSEEEAHQLLKRHLERSVLDSAVVVLSRNNSDDRLEASTELPLDPGFAERITEAKPRDCMAVRLARPHAERTGADPLISCTLCHPMEGSTNCRPLLVGSEVIGSVLMNRPDELPDVDAARLRDSVSQAAPVLANLRNLALAQLRAATDSLTGLPNTRAVQDTLHRLVAQASRMVWPLAAVMLDLDHFKRINDTLGHGRGDEVLAAVGVALHSTVRDSDFVGRYGGEEFMMLLPNTDRAGAATIAERVRQTIADIDALGEQHVTISLGVAMFPEDAPDQARLIRSADRALYRAKANGRNRVEFFSIDEGIDERAGAGVIPARTT